MSPLHLGPKPAECGNLAFPSFGAPQPPTPTHTHLGLAPLIFLAS